jgi:excisionase family DNA binding protein
VAHHEGFQFQPSAGGGVNATVQLSAEAFEAIAQRAAEILEKQIPAGPASPYLTSAEAAEYLRCSSKQRIYDLVHRGALVPRRDGARLLLHRDQLDEYLKGTR